MKNQSVKRVGKDSPQTKQGRDRVMVAAIRCFAEAGFHKTTMRQLAQEAGMSIGNIYWYFSNKEDIIISIVDMFMEHIHAEVDNYPESWSLIELLNFITESHLAGRSTYENMALTFEIMSESTRNPKILRAIQDADLKLRMKLVEKVKEQCAQLSEEEALRKVDAYMLLLYGYQKSKRLSPNINVADVIADINMFIAALFKD